MKNEEELAIESLERNLENLKEEKVMYGRKLDHHKQLVEAYIKEIEFKLQLQAYFNDWKKMVRKNPTYAFEEDEEFLKIDVQLQRFRIEGEIFKLTMQREDAVTMIMQTEKELSRIEGEIPNAEKKLSDARGE